MERTLNQNQFVEKIEELKINRRLLEFVTQRSESTVKRWLRKANLPELTPRQTARLCTLLRVNIYELANIFEPYDSLQEVDIQSVATALRCFPEELSRVLFPEQE